MRDEVIGAIDGVPMCLMTVFSISRTASTPACLDDASPKR